MFHELFNTDGLIESLFLHETLIICPIIINLAIIFLIFSGTNKEPRKRGRRPKTSKGSDVGEEQQPRSKKERRDDSTGGGGGGAGNGPGGGGSGKSDPFRKPSISQLKKTGESWLQDGNCCEVAPKLAKCRECRMTPHQRSKNLYQNIFCRFYAFRKLRFTKNGQLAIAGFSDPHKDASDVSFLI